MTTTSPAQGPTTATSAPAADVPQPQPAPAPTPDLDPTRVRPVPWGGVVARARASEALRRAVPAPVAQAALAAVVRLRAQRDPRSLDWARAAMAAVVDGTHREPDRDGLALAHAVARAQNWELTWRPWSIRRMPVVGLEHLAGLAPGRGVLFSGVHAGPPAAMLALGPLGRTSISVGEHMVQDNPPGYDGYQHEQLRRLARDFGFDPVRARTSARALSRLLEGGGRVFLQFDVPGRTTVQFLGKPVEIAQGTARLACSTGAVVVPAIPVHQQGRWSMHLGSPVDPADHAHWSDLLQTLARIQEGLVLRAPEQFEDPLRAGGWVVADRHGWRSSPPR